MYNKENLTKGRKVSAGDKIDHRHFNCNQEHELNYVSGLYEEKEEVYNFLIESCKNNDINYSTHEEVYNLIKNKLGYTKK